MAMPPGNVIPSEKMQFPVAAAAAATPGAGHWIPDERDGFISWVRGEFAASNAIIDALCQHLEAIGDLYEYEQVFGTIQQRRMNWTPYLHMQHYFPIGDINYALQRILLKRQQLHQHPPQRHFVSDYGKIGGRDFRRSGPGFIKQGTQRGAELTPKDSQNSTLDSQDVKLGTDGNAGKDMEDKALSVAEETIGIGTNGREESKVETENSKASVNQEDSEAVQVNHNCNSSSEDDVVSSEEKQNEKENNGCTGEAFVVTEMYEGKTINVVEGLKLYDKVFDSNEVSRLVSLIHDLRVSGRRGLLQGQTYVMNKRPMRGRGREVIQLGLPIIDDEGVCFKDRKIEPIPLFLHDMIGRMMDMEITPVKPDACIIDFYNEGDHSQPHVFHPCFGRPVSLVLLSECDITFGRVVVSDHPGDYRGSLKLSVPPGSILGVQGKSADLAKHAIHSTRNHRILLTFTKSQPRKTMMTGHNWGPPPSRSLNNHSRIYSSVPPNQYPYPGVLPTPSPRPPIPFQAAVAASIPTMPPPGSSWPMMPPPLRHPPAAPRMPLPGTGVFLPPGSAHPSAHEPGGFSDSSDTSNNNSSSSVEGKEEKTIKEESNGSVDNGEEEGDKQSR